MWVRLVHSILKSLPAANKYVRPLLLMLMLLLALVR
jgi:hypothetical protein